MACRVEFSRAAQHDRDAAVEYLLAKFKSPQAASHFMDELDAVVANLEQHPQMYPASRERRLVRLGYGKALFMSYVVLYKVEGDAAKVARIFHALQDHARLV